ncbi:MULTISPECIES: sensor domain-containing diguanylate cyclase [Agrobacterium]|uniref:Diguanylate cyclase n=1 Tax=Agrobacterium tumefaciens TaxID=358 RepID=A0AAE6EHI8_AGRTU|nr:MULTISPECIES: sensor domain-containing diguanylate cyclase [Agrobacterium]QCL77027.1 diguanylate cyclase [Agrobacterium tumefaciens]QCL82534.1 diguanylate cyclase [Agrobacterium tumefaciens]CUX71026.1 conserved hypothetical protein [Agrobacterium sp. NCPPB 925]
MKELFERAENGRLVSHRDLHIILDAVPVPLSWATLSDGRIQFVNRAFKRVFSYEDDSFLTVDDWIDNAYVDQSERADARQRWRTVWTIAEEGISEVDVQELRVCCGDGKILTVQHRGILLHDIGIGIATFEDVTARKVAEEALSRFSFEDPLTGAGNRRALQAQWSIETTAAAGEPSQHLAVLIVDLDDFKPINDTLGHDCGDAVLKAVACRLRECTRRSDLLFRIGGDEFVLLVPGLSVRETEIVCRRVGYAFDKPFKCAEMEVSVGATIGASLWPRDGDDLREVLRRADNALYRLKKTGKGGWEWYVPLLNNNSV